MQSLVPALLALGGMGLFSVWESGKILTSYIKSLNSLQLGSKSKNKCNLWLFVEKCLSPEFKKAWFNAFTTYRG